MDPQPRSAVSFATEPETFPCLYLTGEQWEHLADRCEDELYARLHEANLANLEGVYESGEAEEIAEAARRERNGIRRRTLKDVLQRGLVAWYVTRDERHLDLARAALRAACGSNQWRVQPEQQGGIRAADLATGELLHIVALGFDALHPYLDPAERDDCLRALIEKGLPAYLDGVALRDWWYRCDFNWNSALHGNAGIAAMVVRHADRDLGDRVLAAALEGLPYLIRAFHVGGGYIEGPMYLCTAVGHLTDFVIPYRRFTGDDLGLLDNRDFQDTLTFLLDMHGGDGRVYNFSDATIGSGGAHLSQILWWARVLHRPDWTADQRAKLLAVSGRGGSHQRHRPGRGPRRRGHGLFRPIEAFWLGEPFQEAAPAPVTPLRHYEGLGWVRWRGERTWLAFRGGYNGGNHDHDDLGNFIFGIDGERFLADAGYGSVLASQHNCITVRRHEQTDGATGRIVRLERRPGGFYLDCDLQEAFPLILEHYHRHLLLVDDQHLLLLDDVRGAHGRADVRSHLQTRLPARRTADGFAIDGAEHTLRVHLLFDAGAMRVVPWDHRRNRLRLPMAALQWEDAWYRRHSVQPSVLTFGEPELGCEWFEDGLEVRIDAHRLRFRRRAGVLELDER